MEGFITFWRGGHRSKMPKHLTTSFSKTEGSNTLKCRPLNSGRTKGCPDSLGCSRPKKEITLMDFVTVMALLGVVVVGVTIANGLSLWLWDLLLDDPEEDTEDTE
jgi:hypothetical protein